MTTRTRRLLTIGAVGGVVLFGQGAYELARLSLIQRRLDRKLAALEAQRQQLLEEQARLESDPTYVEGLIRSTFKLAQPGEYVVPLTDDTRSQ